MEKGLSGGSSLRGAVCGDGFYPHFQVVGELISKLREYLRLELRSLISKI